MPKSADHKSQKLINGLTIRQSFIYASSEPLLNSNVPTVDFISNMESCQKLFDVHGLDALKLIVLNVLCGLVADSRDMNRQLHNFEPKEVLEYIQVYCNVRIPCMMQKSLLEV